VAARENAIADSNQINLDIVRPNVNQHNLEAATMRVQHHAQIVLPGERRFDSEAFRPMQLVIRRSQNLSGPRDWKCRQRGWLQAPSNGVGIKYWNL